MSGTITKKTLLRHPMLIIGLFGFRVWIAGIIGKEEFLTILHKRGVL